MLHFVREIRAVGLQGWLWFVFALGRNEFHPSLDFDPMKDNLDEVLRRRRRAHEIDDILSELKYERQRR